MRHALHLASALALGMAFAAAPAASAQAPEARESAQRQCGDPSRTERVALLIGNAGYDDLDWTALANATHDVERLCDVFGKAGFLAFTLENGSAEQMRAAIDRFAGLARGAEAAIVYYAGHGFEYAGNNYLVPVDAPGFASKNELAERFVPLETLMEQAAGARFSLFFLDACRSYDPVVQLTDIDPEGVDGGVGTIGLPKSGEGVVFYSTVKGRPALDDAPPEDDRISPFAAAVAKHSATPGLELDQYLKIVAREVEQRTREVADPAQYPVRYGQFREDFYLVAPASAGPVDRPEPRSRTRARTGAVRASPSGVLPLPAVIGAISQISLARLAVEDEPYIVADLLSRYDLSQIALAAAGGDPVAQYLLGYMYEFGVGVEQDLKMAREWLSRGAESGHPAAQLEYGYFLLNHDPAARDEARQLYEASAAQGFAKAQSHLAAALWDSSFGEPDAERAKQLFRTAADAGHPYAMFALGVYGIDAERSRTLLEQLSASGNPEGDHWLCELANSRGRPGDVAERCLKAAAGGFAGSQYVTARLYASGQGLASSPREADYWARLARSQPDLPDWRRTQLEPLLLGGSPQ